MSIKEKLSHVLNSEDEDGDDQHPFIGPRAFRRVEADRLRFSGRDAEIDEIAALITSHRIVLIYAQSGAGKTSIINAGVIPSLVKDGFEVLPVARVQVTSPTSPVSPKNGNNNIPSKVENIYIYNALQSLGREKPEIKPESISDLALFEFLDRYFPTRRNENREIRPQLLIFDQLEELFSFYPDNWIEQQRNFFQQVADSLDNNPFLRVVFVIREDFLAQLDPFRSILPEKLRARFRLERLHRREAISAIKKPLKKVLEKATEDEKANIESEINALVNELRKMNVVEVSSGDTRPLEGDFIEPIQLQVVCKRWWREREASKGLQNKVTSPEELGTVDEALEDFYEDAILTASKETRVHESKIRIWCQEKLITPSGTRSMVHRGQNTTEGIDNNVIGWLERKYLIRKEARSGATWYELTHDRLIKPIISSNAKWKDVNDRKKNRKIIIKSGLAVAAATIIILYVILPFLVNIYPPLPTSYEKNDVTVGESPTRVAVNPNTVQTYVANAASDSISAISEQTPISSGQKNREIGQQTIPENAGSENIAVNPATNSNTEIGQQTIPLDLGPDFIAVNPTTNTIYAGNHNSSTVSVIDGKTNSVTDSIPLGDADSDVANDVAVNPNTNTIYVTSFSFDPATKSYAEGSTLFVIDGKTNSVVGSIAMGGAAYHVAVDPKTNTIYVVNFDLGTISVIDGTTNSVIGSIRAADPVNGAAYDVAVNPNTNTIYVTSSAMDPGTFYGENGTISVIDGNTNSMERIDVGGHPNNVAVNPNNNTIYVTDYNSSTISVIDGTTNSVIGSIDVGGTSPSSVAVNPNNNTIYVTDYNSSTISVIDGTTNSVIGSIRAADPVNGAANDVAVNPNTNTIYVANYNSSTVSVIDGTRTNGTIMTGTTNGTTNREVKRIDLGGTANDVAVNPTTNTIYVADTLLNTISVIDGKTNSVVGSIDVGSTPSFIQVNPTTNTIYVGTYGSSAISIINGATNSVMNNSIDVGGKINDIHVHPTTNTIYVASSATDPDTHSRENGAVSIIDGATNREVKRIKVGGDALDVAVHPTTNTIYVAKYDSSTRSSTVSVIDGTTTNGTVTHGLEANDIPMEAGRPLYMAINPATNTIYATSDDEETFYALNGTTNSLVKISRLADGPGDIAVNPDTNTIYVASWYSSTINVIDGKTNSVVDSIPLGDPVTDAANDVAVNPKTNTIYVASASFDRAISYAKDGRVSVINGATRSGLTSGLEPEEVVVGSRPNDVAVNPNTNTIYVAESDSNRVSVIEGKANSVMGKVSVNGSPTSVAVNPNTNTIYVADTLSSKISVIDGTTINGTTTNSVVGSIDVGSRPTSVAVNPNTNTIYVVNYNSSTISVIDGKTNSVVGSIDVGGTSPSSVLRSVIDGRTNSVVGSIDVGSRPTSVAVNPNTNTIYVVNYNSSTISVIDGKTNSVVGSIDVGGTSPSSVAVNPNNNTIYVTDTLSNTVSIIDGRTKSVVRSVMDGTTNSILQRIAVGDAPSDVAVNPKTNTIYVTNEDDGTLSIIKQINNT